MTYHLESWNKINLAFSLIRTVLTIVHVIAYPGTSNAHVRAALSKCCFRVGFFTPMIPPVFTDLLCNIVSMKGFDLRRPQWRKNAYLARILQDPCKKPTTYKILQGIFSLQDTCKMSCRKCINLQDLARKSCKLLGKKCISFQPGVHVRQTDEIISAFKLFCNHFETNKVRHVHDKITLVV